MTTAIVIPARYESTRFPGKPLALIAGKPMIEWVICSAIGSKLADKIIVATEDQRIFDFVKEYSTHNSNLSNRLDACITSKNHQCGTDRICEVVKKYSDINHVVNFQGDEPLMPSEYLDKVIEPLLNGSAEMTSLCTLISKEIDINNPNIVKVVKDKNDFAIYFSRSPIPYHRDLNTQKPKHFKHLGIYGYSRNTILRFSSYPQSELEVAEQLEQLRMLENGIKIKLRVVEKSFPAVDVPDDVKLVEQVLQLK